MTFRRDQQREHWQTMELLKQLYGQGDFAEQYAKEAASPRDEDEDCSDLG